MHILLPSFLILYYWWQLLVVSNQDKSLCIEQGSYTDRLADLWSFIHYAEIKPATCEKGMLDAHTGGSHNQLERKRRGNDPLKKTMLISVYVNQLEVVLLQYFSF